IDIFASHNVRIDTANFAIQSIFFPNTELYFGVKTTNYVTDALSGSYAGIEIKTNTNFVDSQVVYNQDNNSGNPSMFVRGTMTTSNESISPVIDTGRMSVIGVCNRI